MPNISPCHICYVFFSVKCFLNYGGKNYFSHQLTSHQYIYKKEIRFFNFHFKSLPMRAFKLAGARRAARELLSHHLVFVHFGSQGPFFTENKDDNQNSTNRHPAYYIITPGCDSSRHNVTTMHELRQNLSTEIVTLMTRFFKGATCGRNTGPVY